MLSDGSLLECGICREYGFPRRARCKQLRMILLHKEQNNLRRIILLRKNRGEGAIRLKVAWNVRLHHFVRAARQHLPRRREWGSGAVIWSELPHSGLRRRAT